MSRDQHDALMDQMLRELLGGDRPRDLTARVLAQAKIIDRFRRRWWVSAASAFAASIILAASLYMFWPQQYPALEIHGVAVMDGGEAERGKVLQTNEFTPGNLKIGGFINVDISPQTTLAIGSRSNDPDLICFEPPDLDRTAQIRFNPSQPSLTGQQR